MSFDTLDHLNIQPTGHRNRILKHLPLCGKGVPEALLTEEAPMAESSVPLETDSFGLDDVLSDLNTMVNELEALADTGRVNILAGSDDVPPQSPPPTHPIALASPYAVSGPFAQLEASRTVPLGWSLLCSCV